MDFVKDFTPVAGSFSKSNALVRQPVSYWKDAWRRLRSNPIAMISLAVIVVLIVLCVIGPLLRGYDYVTMVPLDKNQPASGKYWWGTYFWTIYDKHLQRFVIIGASLID